MVMDAALRSRVSKALRSVVDPEIGLNIVDLGMVNGIDASAERVRVCLTMTTAACPLSERIVEDAKNVIRAVPGIGQAQVEVVLAWEPPWHPSRMSTEARETFGWNAQRVVRQSRRR